MTKNHRPDEVSAFGRLCDTLVFFAHFFKNPMGLGSPLQSSHSIADIVSRELKGRGASRVIELGPGLGRLTRDVLEALDPAEKLLCVEKEERFCRRLGKRFGERVKVVHGDARQLHSIVAGTRWEQPDAIVCSVPLIIPSTRDLCRIAAELLPPGGLFLQVANVLTPLEAFFDVEKSYSFLGKIPPERFHCAVPKNRRDLSAHGAGYHKGES